MLKKIRLLFLGFIVVAGSACVTPTHASSASSVIITYVQAAGPTGAKEELVVLYNNGAAAVEMTHWCLTNKTITFLCMTFNSEDGEPMHGILPGYSYATVASREYLLAHGLADTAVSFVYDVTNQSSGSIVNSADTISLLNARGGVVSSRVWSAAPVSGKSWARVKLLSSPDMYATNNDATDWTTISWMATPPDSSVEVATQTSEETPEEPEVHPEPPIEEILPIIITEVFPNAAGNDTGKEFIELYNPDPTHAQILDDLRVRIGLESGKWYSIPPGSMLQPREYLLLRDDELGFTLVNTNGGVQLFRGEDAIGERIEYSSPKDDTAWALIGGIWQYATPTPGTENFASLIIEAPTGEQAQQPKPCAANQFRNPETGRCKLTPVIAAPTPCKEGQERNPATNRCRNSVAATTPTSCKEGQVRNPETNRCRTVVKMSSVGYDVKGVQTKASAQLSWYYWAAIIAVVLLIMGYAVWEWRQELTGVWQKVRSAFAKK